MPEILALVLGYLIGSFPTGFVLTRLIRGQDLRQVGSGGTGATNARRALGSKWGIVVAIIDFAKGVAAVLIARGLTDSEIVVALVATIAVAGHCWPIWLGFRGGKGVATGGGAAIALSPWALFLVPLLIVPVILTRYVSLGSLVAALGTPALFGVLALTETVPNAYVVFAIVSAAIIVWRHRENIVRLRGGTERRLSRQSSTV